MGHLNSNWEGKGRPEVSTLFYPIRRFTFVILCERPSKTFNSKLQSYPEELWTIMCFSALLKACYIGSRKWNRGHRVKQGTHDFLSHLLQKRTWNLGCLNFLMPLFTVDWTFQGLLYLCGIMIPFGNFWCSAIALSLYYTRRRQTCPLSPSRTNLDSLLWPVGCTSAVWIRPSRTFAGRWFWSLPDGFHNGSTNIFNILIKNNEKRMKRGWYLWNYSKINSVQKINRFYSIENDLWVSESNNRPIPIIFWLVRYSEIENTWERSRCIYFSSLKPSKIINSLHLCSLEVVFIRSNDIIQVLYIIKNFKVAGSLNQITF
jgi:hypothetical protein